MEFLTAYGTDKGIKKPTNQDALCIKVAQTPKGKVVMAVICDGMGGLAKGEVASASVIKAFEQWFNGQLNEIVTSENYSEIEYQWKRMIQEQNQRIAEYGNKCGVKMGTTLTTLLLIEDKYYIVHVGDSRTYQITNTLQQMTKDQTVVAREIERGNLTPEQAEVDPRRNVLLQCVGASRIVEPDYMEGRFLPNTTWMLCSDGFRHMVKGNEIFHNFQPSELCDEVQMQQKAKQLIETNMNRGETDNITVLLIKAM